MNKKKTSLPIAFLILILSLLIASVSANALTSTNGTTYNMQVTFDESNKLLKAQEQISFTNTYNEELKTLVFHLYPDSYNSAETLPAIGRQMGSDIKLNDDERGDIIISKVLMAGTETKAFTEDNQVLKLNLSSPLKPGDSLQISIDFTLKIPAGTNRLGYLNDVYYLTNWYPIISIYDTSSHKWDENPYNPIGESNYSDTADYNVEIAVPAGTEIASTGIAKSETLNGNTKTVNMTANNVRDFVFIMSKYYKKISKTINNVTVNSFYLDDGNSKNTEATAKKVLEVSSDALQFFSETFGEYPYPELDIVETYLGGGAMEYPQLIQMGKYHPLPADQFGGAYYTPFEEMAAVHETGHQWWYVTVGSNEFKEPFLDESMTAYSTAYYYEKKVDKYSPSGVIQSMRQRIYPGMKNNTPIGSGVDKFKDWQDYSLTIYNVGPLVFEDIRQRIGEEKFLQFIKAYYETFKLKNASINGFLNLLKNYTDEETYNTIKNALESSEYYPKNLMLTEEESTTLRKETTKRELKGIASTKPQSFASLILKGINGENIYLVKPTSISTEEKEQLDQVIDNMGNFLKNIYGVSFEVREDSSITDEEKKNSNLIVLGNPSNNSIFKELQLHLPVFISSFGICMKDMIIFNKNISGNFIAKNPYNEDKLIFSSFWTSSLSNVYLDYGNLYNQFSINVGNKKTVSGDY